MIWRGILAVAAAILLRYRDAGPNAVWGTATLALFVGLGLAVYQPGFEWWTVGKAVSVGALLGLGFELLPNLARRN